MTVTLQIATVLIVAIAMATMLAHALELPGKLRLSKDEYLAVQKIYYPGFTVGGAAEPFVALAAAHATYWVVTHPVNNFWLKDVELKSLGGSFFAFDPLSRSGTTDDWTTLRDRWEFSHAWRAAFGVASLTLLAAAVAV
jgi:hypothetical protein